MCIATDTKTKRKVKVRVLLDNASDLTLIKQSTAEKLRDLTKDKPVSASFAGTGHIVTENKDQRRIWFTLEPVTTHKHGKKAVPVTGEEFITQPIEAATIPLVSGAYRPVCIDPKDYTNLKDFNDWTEKYPTPYPIAENADIDILLGVPQVHFINYRQTEHPEIDQQGTAPVAIHTKFGSAISAPKWPVENSNIHNTTMTDGSLGNLTFFSALDGIDLAQ